MKLQGGKTNQSSQETKSTKPSLQGEIATELIESEGLSTEEEGEEGKPQLQGTLLEQV